MAMRMSNVDPDRAKAEAEAAINDGLIEKNIEYNTMAINGTNHPLAFISILWNDTRMNASLENIMKRLKVPFMDKIFDKNSDDIRNEDGEVTMTAGTAIVGVPAGIQLTRATTTTSTPNTRVYRVPLPTSRWLSSNSRSATSSRPKPPCAGTSEARSRRAI